VRPRDSSPSMPDNSGLPPTCLECTLEMRQLGWAHLQGKEAPRTNSHESSYRQQVGTAKVVTDLPAFKGFGGATVVLFVLLFRAETCGMVQTGLPGNRYNHRQFRDGSYCCSAVQMLQDGLKGRCSTTELRPYGVNPSL
jgi:hypothetical protein